MDPVPPVSCSNCKQYTDSSGKSVWICEHCGTENPPVEPSTIAAPVSAPAPDAAAAQAEINAVLPASSPTLSVMPEENPPVPTVSNLSGGTRVIPPLEPVTPPSEIPMAPAPDPSVGWMSSSSIVAPTPDIK